MLKCQGAYLVLGLLINTPIFAGCATNTNFYRTKIGWYKIPYANIEYGKKFVDVKKMLETDVHKNTAISNLEQHVCDASKHKLAAQQVCTCCEKCKLLEDEIYKELSQ